MKDHHINIFWSDEDGGHIADIPDLDACSAFGKTPAEALAEAERAKSAWLEAARAVMLRSKPRTALTPTGQHTDSENLIVSNDPEFRALIERSRSLYKPGTGFTTENVRRRLVAKRGARAKARRRG